MSAGLPCRSFRLRSFDPSVPITWGDCYILLECRNRLNNKSWALVNLLANGVAKFSVRIRAPLWFNLNSFFFNLTELPKED